jgi:Predicted nucleotide-binding protein containing TIR-like domain
MNTDEAALAAEALERHRAELLSILRDLESTGDGVFGGHRFRRWKSRAVKTIGATVNFDEAQRFEATYVPLIMGRGELPALVEEIERHDASLASLLEEIAQRPHELARGDTTDQPTAPVEKEDGLTRPLPAEEIDPRKVFVIHGRDEEARRALFALLQDLDLHPIQWEELVRATGRGSPYNGEVVARAFSEARAVIVLMTPDDEARLHSSLHGAEEPKHERELTGQARPNVFLEAGMAMQSQPDRTIFVELGALRPASDLHGLNVVRLGGSEGALLALVGRLETAGCAVNRTNESWMNRERFSSLSAITRRPEASREETARLPRGERLPQERPTPAPPDLSAILHQSGKNHLLEVVNRGGVALSNVRWVFPADATNWSVRTEVLPEYPIKNLAPREHVRVPVGVFMGGPVIVDVEFQAEAEGEPFNTTVRLSIYG